MKKIMAVSALAVAGMFSAQALADGSKTGFYVTGKAGTSVVSLSDQRFIDGEGEWADRYKGGVPTVQYPGSYGTGVLCSWKS